MLLNELPMWSDYINILNDYNIKSCESIISIASQKDGLKNLSTALNIKVDNLVILINKTKELFNNDEISFLESKPKTYSTGVISNVINDI